MQEKGKGQGDETNGLLYLVQEMHEPRYSDLCGRIERALRALLQQLEEAVGFHIRQDHFPALVEREREVSYCRDREELSERTMERETERETRRTRESTDC